MAWPSHGQPSGNVASATHPRRGHATLAKRGSRYDLRCASGPCPEGPVLRGSTVPEPNLEAVARCADRLGHATRRMVGTCAHSSFSQIACGAQQKDTRSEWWYSSRAGNATT